MLKTGPHEAENHEVSLFDSLYGEPPADPDAPAAEPDHSDRSPSNADAPSPLAVDTPPIEIAPIEIAPIEIAPAAPGPDTSRPAPIAFEAPTMSLQDFATEVFGTRGEMAASPADASAFAAAATQPDVGDAGAEGAESSFAALSSLATGFDAPDTPPGPAEPDPRSALALAPVRSEDTADASPFATDTSLLPPGNDGGTIDSGVAFEAISLIDDDLLPTRRPKRGLPLPSRGAAGSGDAPSVSGGFAQRAKMAGLVVLALASGFFGYRTFAPGGSDGGAQTASLAGPPAAPQPDAAAPFGLGAPLGAIEPAQLAAAEVELRNVGLEAQAHFAESGTYALDATAWDHVIDAQVVAAGSPVTQGAFQVVADQDAACFQTATAGGASVAIGVTGQGLTFATDAAGASICNADASVLAGWAISLATSAG